MTHATRSTITLALALFSAVVVMLWVSGIFPLVPTGIALFVAFLAAFELDRYRRGRS